MRTKILIAVNDKTYTNHLTEYLTENYSDIIEADVINEPSCLTEQIETFRYDVVLIDESFIDEITQDCAKLIILLWSEQSNIDNHKGYKQIHKHQKISKIISEIFEQYSKVSIGIPNINRKIANITAVWSPAGGVGKTTVAYLYASKKAKDNKKVMYLNLESFSTVPVFFKDKGKSISDVFEMLNSETGDIKMLIQSLCSTKNGITYLNPPNNYDDLCVLSAENIYELVLVCSEITEELIVDLSCECDTRTRQIFALASEILLVTEASETAKTKLSQFITQNNVFENIKDRTTIVTNKGAIIDESYTEKQINLPLVQSTDAITVCKTLLSLDVVEM
ncbi:MAG: hypothetical protein LBC73_00075 [Oscillospiraceae bacterium]|jgi:MinD-like ATPase involved in chromosome partitioning or flagellar assembly|nr:hypothetical protein [Oscillospiraceae bacterium]